MDGQDSDGCPDPDDDDGPMLDSPVLAEDRIVLG